MQVLYATPVSVRNVGENGLPARCGPVLSAPSSVLSSLFSLQHWLTDAFLFVAYYMAVWTVHSCQCPRCQDAACGIRDSHSSCLFPQFLGLVYADSLELSLLIIIMDGARVGALLKEKLIFVGDASVFLNGVSANHAEDKLSKCSLYSRVY